MISNYDTLYTVSKLLHIAKLQTCLYNTYKQVCKEVYKEVKNNTEKVLTNKQACGTLIIVNELLNRVGGIDMTVKELVSIMNISDVELASKNYLDLLPPVKIDMRNLENDKTIQKYGNCKVNSLTNVAKMGDTIWI